ncbi:MAG: Superfamily I DNA and/or RNA helicase [Verrucomicrobia bacterium]|nr:MAG: Superfamily I DNA and/or RNA helicase [Verrucomicrobiota bacterium]
MEQPPSFPFQVFLGDSVKTRLSAEKIVAAIVPLIEQVLETHERGLVAPLSGIGALHATHGSLWFRESDAHEPARNHDVLDRLQPARNRPIEIVGVMSGKENRLILGPRDKVSYPSYVTDYIAWEHLVGHHDPATDVFSIGMILASLALGLDFRDRAALTKFVENRHNLFRLYPELNPAIQKVILKTTETVRSRRFQNLKMIRDYLFHFRAGKAVDAGKLPVFPGCGVAGDKRTAVLKHLRDKLFDTTRRNKLIYHEPSAQSVNLTDASIPRTLAYQSLDMRQFFLWQPDLEDRFREGRRIRLDCYFSEETAQETGAALQRVLQTAKQHEKDYGFSNLRLALSFLHWHNLRDAASQNEVIHSPLLLLPVRLEAAHGVQDSFDLEPIGTEVEVNPALRHFLKLLYNLDLPEKIDLTMTSPLEFGEALKQSIEASAHSLSLNIVDRTRIRLWRDRVPYVPVNDVVPNRLCGENVGTYCEVSYSYRSSPMVPLGVRLFETYIRTAALPLEYSHYEQERYDTVTESMSNPYVWEYDLCSVTLGNFDFQKMTLVHDYDELLDRGISHESFDDLFSSMGRCAGEELEDLGLPDQSLIAPADPTQISAIARARTGQNMIIQGPPGTGKSQTIANLIADYLSRRMRVLFVCEKRAALDVVHSRLSRAQLGQQVVLIHDSQKDRGPFLGNLRDSYEQAQGCGAGNQRDPVSSQLVESIRSSLASLNSYSSELLLPLKDAPVSTLQLLERMIELRPHAVRMEPSGDSQLPGYGRWLASGRALYEVADALQGAGRRRALGANPLRDLSFDCFSGEIPVAQIRKELELRENAVHQLAKLMGDLDETFGRMRLCEMPPLVTLASQAHYFVIHELMGMVREDSFESRRLRELDAELHDLLVRMERTREENRHWKERLPATELSPALETSRFLDHVHCRFLHRRFWRLREVLRQRYDFQGHSVVPRWTSLLASLESEYALAGEIEALEARIRREFRVPDTLALLNATRQLRELQQRLPDSVRMRELLHLLASGRDSRRTVADLHLAGVFLGELRGLEQILPGYEERTAGELRGMCGGVLQELASLPELAPSLRGLVTLPSDLYEVARSVELEPEALELAIGRKAVMERLESSRELKRLDGPTYRKCCEDLTQLYQSWIEHNGRQLASRSRQAAWQALQVPNGPEEQLVHGERERRKRVQEGKCLLEHQFGLKQRFKSIREIATGSREFLFDLKPVWLMSPLSISQTLPLEADLFDVVIFDEASQIKLEDAIPSIFRGKQVIVVGDEMQLPPTNFFNAGTLEDEETVLYREENRVEAMDLSAESLLSHAALRLPSTLLGWHYRSRHEALISFSNHAFYGGELLTVPDRQAVEERREPIVLRDPSETGPACSAAMERSISVHHVREGVYDKRRNVREAICIAGLVRDLLRRQRDFEPGARQTVGVVAFSDAQQEEIERALEQLAKADADFHRLLAAERERVEGGEITGLFVKNLENVQGDERDIIILSVCYAPGPDGKMKMNFGPINQAGGEKRLNVILSRARRHMMVVTSISASQITNDWNDGARYLRNFLEYASAVSVGDRELAERVLLRLRPVGRETDGGADPRKEGGSVTSRALATALRARGYEVSTENGESGFKIDVAVRRTGQPDYELAILLDGQVRCAGADALERAVLRPGILKSFGWRVFDVLSKDWYENPEMVLLQIETALGSVALSVGGHSLS